MSLCLIFGATGQDGRLLARRFARAGYRVVGVSRQPDADHERMVGTFLAHFDHIVGSFAISFAATEALLESLQPSVIVNVAGLSSVGASFSAPMETFLDNGNLNLFILEALRRAGSRARYVFASSGEVFGETLAGGAEPDSRFDPRSPYAVSKASASLVVRNYREVYGVNAGVAFLFPHESPLRGPAFVVPKIVQSLRDLRAGRIRTLRFGRLDVVRDWGWADDHMDAVFRQTQLDGAADFVIGTGGGVALMDMLRHGMRRIGMEDDALLCIEPSLVRPADLRRSIGSPSRIGAAAGWRPGCSGLAVLDRLLDHAIDDLRVASVETLAV